MTTAYIYDHVRTPRGRGRPDGALHEATPVPLAATVLKSLRERNPSHPLDGLRPYVSRLP